MNGSIRRGRSAGRRAAAVVHLHLHIIGIKGALGRIVSGAELVGRIWNDWGVVGTSAGVPNDHMTFFKVLDECMKVVQLKTATRVITALRAVKVSQEAGRAPTSRRTMSSSLPTILRAFNKEPLSLSMLELTRVALKSVGLEGKEDEVRESSREMETVYKGTAEQPGTNG